MNHKNLFATVLTYAAPSANYRGESEENRTVLQRIKKREVMGQDGACKEAEYAVISPESMRNALREILADKGLPCNRRRLHDKDQLAVEFKEFPDASKWADDFFFGHLVADPKAVKENQGKPARRDSVLRMNMAVALTPYRFDATFHQSPLNAGESSWHNAKVSALLHREVTHTAYQYPFALSLADCGKGRGREWTPVLLEAIGQLSNVAGGHARSYFEMAPRSIVVRLTPSLVAGFNTYGFDEQGGFAELTRVNADDLPGKEFWVGGELARQLEAGERKRLESQGVHFFASPQALLGKLGKVLFEEG